jgi:hypothetical protein
MTFPEIYEQSISLVSGGTETVDSRYGKGTIYSLVNTSRSIIALERFKADMAQPTSYFQEYEPEFVSQAQDSGLCCSIFYDCPELIGINNLSSGLGYVGTVDGKPARFAEVVSEADMAMILQDRITRIPLTPYVLRSAGNIRVYWKSTVKRFKMTGIFSDPRDIPTYDIELSQYPIDEGDLARVYAYILQALGASTKIPEDRIANSKDNTQP